jgi:hypothetical protein
MQQLEGVPLVTAALSNFSFSSVISFSCIVAGSAKFTAWLSCFFASLDLCLQVHEHLPLHRLESSWQSTEELGS